MRFVCGMGFRLEAAFNLHSGGMSSTGNNHSIRFFGTLLRARGAKNGIGVRFRLGVAFGYGSSSFGPVCTLDFLGEGIQLSERNLNSCESISLCLKQRIFSAND